MIETIIFDMGNVLLDYNPSLPLHACLKTEEDIALIQKELFEGPDWVAGDYGIITNEERYDRVKERVPERLHKELFQCVNQWYEFLKPVEGAKEFVEKAKEKGYKIFILSNACSSFYQYFPRFLPLNFFDGVVVSADLHLIKPDRRIYEYILEK